MVCRGNRVYSTNVKDIVLMKTSENIDVKLLKIEPEDVSYAAEIPSLSLFLQFKMEVMERQKNALGKSVLCKMNLKEPGDSPPRTGWATRCSCSDGATCVQVCVFSRPLLS